MASPDPPALPPGLTEVGSLSLGVTDYSTLVVSLTFLDSAEDVST